MGGVWDLYELAPAFAVALIVIVVVSLITKAPEEEITNEFEHDVAAVAAVAAVGAALRHERFAAEAAAAVAAVSGLHGDFSTIDKHELAPG